LDLIDEGFNKIPMLRIGERLRGSPGKHKCENIENDQGTRKAKDTEEMSRNRRRIWTETRARDRELKRGKDSVLAVRAMTLLGK